VVFLWGPLLLVAAAAFAPSEALGISSEQWATGAGAGRAFGLVLDTYGAHLGHSVEVALTTACLALALGVPAGVSLGLAGRSLSPLERQLGRGIEILITLPLGLPGLVVAMGLLVTYPGCGGDLGLLVAGHVLYTLPYAVRSVAVAARATALGELLDAARTLGAGRWALARHVLWPALRRAVITSTLMALAISWGEFNVTFLLATPARGTFPTALYLAYTTNSFPVAAAATGILLAGLGPLFGLAFLLGGAPRPEQGA
jgi:putative spermidine/putrescine transport system permease protein